MNCNWSGPLRGVNRGYACLTCHARAERLADMRCGQKVEDKPAATAPARKKGTRANGNR